MVSPNFKFRWVIRPYPSSLSLLLSQIIWVISIEPKYVHYMTLFTFWSCFRDGISWCRSLCVPSLSLWLSFSETWLAQKTWTTSYRYAHYIYHNHILSVWVKVSIPWPLNYAGGDLGGVFKIRRGGAGNHLSGEAERGRRRRSHCQNFRRIQRGRRSEKGQRQFERKVSSGINVAKFSSVLSRKR